MPSGASNKALLAILLAAATATIGLKAMIGAPGYATASAKRLALENHLATILQRQGFSTGIEPLRIQSPIVHAVRGACRLTVRDASSGAPGAAAFAKAAHDVGPLVYWYRGASYDSPPALRIRVDEWKTAIMDRAGLAPTVYVPVALATSEGCGSGDFGLGKVQAV